MYVYVYSNKTKDFRATAQKNRTTCLKKPILEQREFRLLYRTLLVIALKSVIISERFADPNP